MLNKSDFRNIYILDIPLLANYKNLMLAKKLEKISKLKFPFKNPSISIRHINFLTVSFLDLLVI